MRETKTKICIICGKEFQVYKNKKNHSRCGPGIRPIQAITCAGYFAKKKCTSHYKEIYGRVLTRLRSLGWRPHEKRK